MRYYNISITIFGFSHIVNYIQSTIAQILQVRDILASEESDIFITIRMYTVWLQISISIWFIIPSVMVKLFTILLAREQQD